MKRFYCEYNNGLKDRNAWCVVRAIDIDHVKRIIASYGFTFVNAWEL